jgi:hypothetical protein
LRSARLPGWRQAPGTDAAGQNQRPGDDQNQSGPACKASGCIIRHTRHLRPLLETAIRP